MFAGVFPVSERGLLTSSPPEGERFQPRLAPRCRFAVHRPGSPVASYALMIILYHRRGPVSPGQLQFGNQHVFV